MKYIFLIPVILIPAAVLISMQVKTDNNESVVSASSRVENHHTKVSGRSLSSPVNNSSNEYIFFLSEEILAEIRASNENSVFVDRDGKVYPHYSKEILMSLAAQGDLRAIKERVYRYLHEKPEYLEGDSREVTDKNRALQREWHEQRNKYLYEAVLYGDREFLAAASPMYFRHVDPSDLEANRVVLLEQLGFLEFVGKRGKVMDKYYMAISAVKIYEEMYGKLQLTDADKAFIRDQAKDIYDGFEKKRIEMGLGEFDNSVSDWALEGAEEPRRAYEEALGNNAF